MCGIAGILDLGGGIIDRTAVERLCARLVHRGPDEQGYFQDGCAALGQRRLSIIDLAGGRQPLCNEDGTVWVTFNGEIYNFKELRVSLEGHGHRFATDSDTEVIVHAYEQYGIEAVKQFRGMFAFALWDGRRRTLFLARDQVGKKPLFYAEAGGQFVFASELQAILEHPGVRRQADPRAVEDYLTYGYVPAPRSAFQGVCKLPPAHHLTLEVDSGGGARVERYWQLEYGPKLRLREEEAAEALLEVLTEAVRLRLVADVPLGALLSGGIDSSLVVALMSRLSNRPVKTFSVGFDERDFDELPYARLVAQRWGAEHHEMVVRANALEIVPTLVRHYGEPFADSSAVPTYYVAKLTRERVKVVLTGDGGDESFAGYERYLGNMLAEHYQKLPWLLRHGVLLPLASLVPNALPRRNRLRQARRFLEKADQPAARRYLAWVGYFTPEQKRELLTPEFRDQLAGYCGEEWFAEQFDAARAAGAEGLDTPLAVDVRSYLPYDLLVKMDIATMANSLEARSPLLDHKVMEFAARLPARYKLRGTTLKYLLRKVAGSFLPPETLRRRKMGFGVPVGQWLRSGLRPVLEEVLLSPRSLGRGYFRPPAMRRLVREHTEGQQDHTNQLWALLCLEWWHREFIP